MMESLLSRAGDANRIEDFIKNKKFREPRMEASIAMDLCFSSAYECQMRFFSDSWVLVRSFFNTDCYVCMM